ncbi:cupin domain-containing protein [bacterium CPR1]|nr:cupin domain-containing protein [bacterium CPR1]
MAYVVVKEEPARRLEGEQALTFLASRGIGYQQWDVSKVPAELRTFGKLDEDEQRRLLATWGDQIDRLMRSNDYKTADVLAVSDETVPNLDAVLDKFRPEHYHTEDEVRFVISGHGMFGIHQDQPDERTFEVHVGPGDLLMVPQGTWHWFDLKEDRCIQCVRLFQDMSGWTPYYRTAEMPAARP